MPDRLLALAVAASTPSPSASGSSGSSGQSPKGLDPNKVTPGIEGFLAIFALVVVTVLLIRSMVARVRRIRYRAARSGEITPSGLPERAPSARPQAPGRLSARRAALPQAAPAPPGPEGDEPPHSRQDDPNHLG